MGKLLDLAMLALNNKNHYSSDIIYYDETSSSSKYFHLRTKIIIDFHSISPKLSDTRTEYFNGLFNSHIANSKSKVYPMLIFQFDEEPPMEMSCRNEYIDPVQHQGSLVVESKSIFRADKKYSFSYTLSEISYNFELRCGSIVEEIDEKVYIELLKTYSDNKTKYQRQADLEKIESRINRENLIVQILDLITSADT